ncbi:MAG TPA: hypothetical protein VMU30_10965 [Bacteroidota bacterium]|nr:hypothetical protein [Bacteroidota bacterium]
MKVTTKIFGIVSLMGLFAATLDAQILEDGLRYSQAGLGVGARELGMGNATVGGVNDYSALFWNPAGLAFDKNFEFSFGLTRTDYSNDASYLGTTTNSDKSTINLNNIGIVYPVATARGSLTFAFGFNRAANYTATSTVNAFNSSSSFTQSDALLNQPYDYNVSDWLGVAHYDSLTGISTPLLNGNVQQMFNFLEGGGLNHWTFGGAMDIAKNLSFGVSLNFAAGSYSFDGTFDETDAHNLYTTPPTDFSKFGYEYNVNDDITGVNALFGLMYKKPGKYSFGISLRTPTSYDITDKTTELYGSSTFKTADANGYSSYSYPFTAYDPVKYSITSPWVFSGGISVQAFDWLVLAGDAEYTDWTTIEFSSDDANNDETMSSLNSEVKNELQATTNLRGGAEITLWSIGLKLRGGIIYNPTPYKNSPSSYDQTYYTGGVGFDFDQNTSLNLGYAYGTWKQARTIYSYTDASNNTNYVGSNESITLNYINLTLTYRF